MIKNAILYRIAPECTINATLIEDGLQAAAFTPCGATQEHSAGFVPPRGEANGPLVESIGGHRILKLMIETKSVPGDVVKRKAAEQADLIEQTTGRKPGKKEMKAIREDAIMSLLPTAFPKQSAHLIWIDPAAGTLVIDASSQSKADTVVTALVQAVPGIGLQMLQTAESPQACMTQWLLAEPEDWPANISVERGCELRSNDEEKSVVKFTRHNLVNYEVHQHIQQGKLPVKLALSWDGRVSFVLTDTMQIKSIQFLEGVYEGRDANAVDGFDADVAIMTGEMSKMLVDLVESMGGEV
jgi:recombination associated protein RdgC